MVEQGKTYRLGKHIVRTLIGPYSPKNPDYIYVQRFIKSTKSWSKTPWLSRKDELQETES